MLQPHNPLICSRELFDYYMELVPMPEPTSRDYLDSLHPAMQKWRERREVDALTPEQNQRGLAAYYGLVAQTDANVGRIVEAIGTSAAAERTIIIYCSDHGDMACEHGMWWKSNFYEGSVGIPLIASGPGLPQDVSSDAIVSLIDVGPTMLEAAGAEPLPDVDGRSFHGLLTGNGEMSDWKNEVFAEYGGLWGDEPGCMIRTGPWKLNYYHEFKSYQLFNLEEDPDELSDRAGDSACAKIAEECLSKIHARWSAEEYLEKSARARRAMDVIRRSGHELSPHEVTHFSAPFEDNEFDYSQLPQQPKPRKTQ